MSYKAYIINLDRSVDRLAYASQQLNELDIPFERVPAAIGSDSLSAEERKKTDDRSIEKMGFTLLAGEIGCYLSHIACLDRFLKTTDEFFLVFEDDFEISTENGELLQELIRSLNDKTLPGSFNVISLASSNKWIYSNIVSLDANERSASLRNSHYFPFCLTGLLWSRSGAEKFLSECREIGRPIDVELQYWIAAYGGGWTFDRPLVHAGNFESEIDGVDPRNNQVPTSRWIKRKRHALFCICGLKNLVYFRMSHGKSR